MGWNEKNLIKVLKEGGVAVMPTDTLYGIVASAFDVLAVNRIYDLRKRTPNKPCIVLVGDIDELEKFGIDVTSEQENIIKEFKDPTSFILDCPDEKFSYLHRGTKTLAFRIPSNLELQNLLKQTGPLIAPSANTEAMPPSKNITEAKKYFGDLVNLYIDGGEISGKASKVVRLHKDGFVETIRS